MVVARRLGIGGDADSRSGGGMVGGRGGDRQYSGGEV